MCSAHADSQNLTAFTIEWDAIDIYWHEERCMTDLTGKTLLVTHADQPVGREAVAASLRAGARVLAHTDAALHERIRGRGLVGCVAG